MSARSTLESTAAAFNHWRKTRTSGKTAVPTALRQQAIGLLARYKQSHIITALNINHGMFKQWQSSSPVPVSTPVFIPLIADETHRSDLTSPLNITLHHPSGSKMCIAGDVSLALLQHLTHVFMTVQAGDS